MVPPPIETGEGGSLGVENGGACTTHGHGSKGDSIVWGLVLEPFSLQNENDEIRWYQPGIQ